MWREYNASDIYLTTGATPFPEGARRESTIGRKKLTPGQTRQLAYSMMNMEQIDQFERVKELNTAFGRRHGRFRINVYQQRGEVAIVGRFINSHGPHTGCTRFATGGRQLAMLQRGLVLVVGSTGSGKSTTLASMINHRASTQAGHILTLEEPIEYFISHQKATVDQREIGVDSMSFADALRNAMRQAPDVIVIGEIRDRETMQSAISSPRQALVHLDPARQQRKPGHQAHPELLP